MVNVISRDYNNNAETGWIEYPGSPHVFETHTCWQLGNNQSCNDSGVIASGTWDAFKIASWPTGSNYFDSWIDKHDGKGWVLVQSNGPDMGYSNGIAFAETGKYGDTTGALDHHKGLTYKLSGGSWPDWAQQFLTTHFAYNLSGYYYPGKMTNTEYEICKNGGSCPWQ